MAKTYIANMQEVQNVLGKYLSPHLVNDAVSELQKTEAIREVNTTESKIADKIIQSGLVLTDDEIEIFKSYIDDGDMEVAFGNSDWVEIYLKITRFAFSDKAANLVDKYRTTYDS